MKHRQLAEQNLISAYTMYLYIPNIMREYFTFNDTNMIEIENVDNVFLGEIVVTPYSVCFMKYFDENVWKYKKREPSEETS